MAGMNEERQQRLFTVILYIFIKNKYKWPMGKAKNPPTPPKKKKKKKNILAFFFFSVRLVFISVYFYFILF